MPQLRILWAGNDPKQTLITLAFWGLDQQGAKVRKHSYHSKSPVLGHFIENIRAGLNRVDTKIMQAYAELVIDQNIKEKFIQIILEEYNRTIIFMDKLAPLVKNPMKGNFNLHV